MLPQNEMKNIKLIANHNNTKFIIEQDNPDIGYYLYVWKNNQCIADHLQDTLEKAKEFAFEEYNVPFSEWSGIG